MSPVKLDEISTVTSKIHGIIQEMSLEERRWLLNLLERHEKEGATRFRRKFTRKNYRIQVDYTVEGRIHTGLAINLSAGGMFIETSKAMLPKFKKGSEIILTFQHPEREEHLKITGQIARIDESGGIGVQFDQSILDWWTT